MNKKASPSKPHADTPQGKPKVVLPKPNETMTVRGMWSVKGLSK